MIVREIDFFLLSSSWFARTSGKIWTLETFRQHPAARRWKFPCPTSRLRLHVSCLLMERGRWLHVSRFHHILTGFNLSRFIRQGGDDHKQSGGSDGAAAAAEDARTTRKFKSSRQDGRPGCEHYLRKCMLVASGCCGEIFWCRHCHNDEKHDKERDPNKAHQLDRTKVQEVICASCETRQPVSNQCVACAITFADYFCSTCRFFDDDTSKGQFHCDGCGICRVGGRENYFHCDKCVACLPFSMLGAHKCMTESLRVNCPVCLEFLMDSLNSATILKCGHAIHSACQDALLRSGNPRCPICNASFLDMSEQWRFIDQIIAANPMPEEFRTWSVEILCADCHETSQCLFHVEGLKCGGCGGYNTTRSGRESPPAAVAGPTQDRGEGRLGTGGTQIEDASAGGDLAGDGESSGEWETEEEWETDEETQGEGR